MDRYGSKKGSYYKDTQKISDCEDQIQQLTLKLHETRD